MASKIKKNFKTIFVVSEFNSLVCEKLLNSALDACKSYNSISEDLQIFKVSGAFEIPGAINCVLENSSPDLIITLGSIIRGETTHYNHVAENCARGVAQLSLANNIPIIFGVLCTENLEQALDRAEAKGKDMVKAGIGTLLTYEKIKFDK